METITSSDEISQLFSDGHRTKTPFVTFIIDRHKNSVLQVPEGHDRKGRVAFIAGKKLGNAVWRNKAKRRMRAICYELGGPWPGFDVIFLARPALTQASYSKVLSTCDKALNSLVHEGYTREDT